MSTTKPNSNQIEQHNVLIISQDVDMARVWKTLFEQRNCRVISEPTAQEGLTASRLVSPTLIILDIDLPDGERLSLCKELRATTNGTLLLLNSGHTNIDVLEYHRAGVDETVTDAISPMALLIKSLAWLARHDWIVPRRLSAQHLGV